MKLLFCDNYCLLEKTLRNQNHVFSLSERLEIAKFEIKLSGPGLCFMPFQLLKHNSFCDLDLTGTII